MICIAIATLDTGACRVQRFESAVAIGRDQRCDLVLSARGVSGSHCRLSPMPGLQGAFMLEDLGSTYGTFVNDVRIGKPVVVSGRDVVTIGGHRLILAEVGQENAALERLRAMDGPRDVPAPRAASPKSSVPVEIASFDPAAPWIQQFEHFDELARAWHGSGRNKQRLLKGATIAVAEQWLAAGVRQSPAPDALHRDFIDRSRKERSFQVMVVASVSVGLALVVAVVVGWQWLGSRLRGALDTPEVVSTSMEPGTTQQAEGGAVDLRALVETSIQVEDLPSRLLVQASVAKVARAQGSSMLSETMWSLQSSAHAALGQLQETVLPGHAGPITAVAFSPSGAWVASASEDGSARLWDLASPSPARVFTLRGHIGPVTALAFQPTGGVLVTAGDDGRLWRWDSDASDPGGTGQVLKSHQSAVRKLAWGPNGRFLVSGDNAGVLVAWDMQADPPHPVSRAAHDGPVTGLQFGGAAEEPELYSASDDRTVRKWTIRPDGSLARALTLDDHTGGVSAIAVDPNHVWLASSTTARELYLWPLPGPDGTRRKLFGLRPGKPLPLLGHRDRVTQLAFTPDGHWLLSAGDDGTLRMWDLTAKDPSVTSIVLSGHSGDIQGLALAAGGQRAVTAASDNALRVWDLAKAQRVVDQVELAGHDAPVGAVGVSSDGLRIVSGADDGSVLVWDALGRSAGRGGRRLRLGPKPVQDVAVSAAGHAFAVSEGRASVWDLSDPGRWPRAIPFPQFDGRSDGQLDGLMNAAAFDPTGRVIAAGTESGSVEVWPFSGDVVGRRVSLQGHDGPVNALAFVPDGRLLTVSSDHSVRVWHVDQPDRVETWNAHPDEVHRLAITPKGDYAITGGLDGTLVRWSLADGSAVALAGHEGEILALSVSEDGRTLASASADRRVRLWDVATGAASLVLRGHDEAVQAVAFGRNGLLATAGQDRKILLWDLQAEHPDEAPRALAGHEQSVTALQFLADGSVLASASNDKTVRLWRVDGGEPLVLTGHDQVVSQLAVSHDAQWLVSASFDGTVRLWPLRHSSFERLICDVLGRGLEPGAAAATLGQAAPDPCVAPDANR